MKRMIFGAAAAFSAIFGLAAAEPPAYLIKNATIHTLAGEPIERGSVLIAEGRVAGVGRDLKAPRGAEVIDARGKHLYPGLFDAYSAVGLTEISAVAATRDLIEEGDFNPHLRALTAVHPDSEHIPVSRTTGVTHALTAMNGEGMAGQAAVIHLDGWTYEEMGIEAAGPLVLRWPEIRVFEPREGQKEEPDRPTTIEKARERHREQRAAIERRIEAARHYAAAAAAGLSADQVDRKLEALVPAVEGRRAVIVLAERERAIRQAVEFAAEQGLKMILAGGGEAWKVKELLAEKRIPVILGPAQALPLDEDDPYDRVFSQPEELRRAGILFAFGTGIPASASSSVWPASRTLPYEAASAVPYGLPREEALKAVTVNPARILGLEDRLGTIEEGKIANLILVDGDPLEVTTRLERIFINGRAVSTEDKHRRLYERYLNRP